MRESVKMFSRTLRTKLNIVTPLFLPVRGTRYPTYYQEPVYQIEKLKSDENLVQDLKFVPIKAAKHDDTCSVFHNEVVNKFTNMIMRHGKKELARNMLSKALENVKRVQVEAYNKSTAESKENIECNPTAILEKALDNCKPVMGITLVKRGGTFYQVPVPLTANRSRFLSMKWMIEASQDKFRRVHFPEKLAQELLDAYHNKGQVVKKKNDLHKLCEANKAYAHFRWG